MHTSLRPYVGDADELYTALGKLQAHASARLGCRALLLVTLMAVGMVATGSVGQVAWCLAAVTGVACMGSVADYAGRNSLMDSLTLHDLIRPRDEVGAAAIELIQTLAEGATSPGELGHG